MYYIPGGMLYKITETVLGAIDFVKVGGPGWKNYAWEILSDRDKRPGRCSML